MRRYAFLTALAVIFSGCAVTTPPKTASVAETVPPLPSLSAQQCGSYGTLNGVRVAGGREGADGRMHLILLGSGFVVRWGTKEYVVTNAHNVMRDLNGPTHGANLYPGIAALDFFGTRAFARLVPNSVITTSQTAPQGIYSLLTDMAVYEIKKKYPGFNAKPFVLSFSRPSGPMPYSLHSAPELTQKKPPELIHSLGYASRWEGVLLLHGGNSAVYVAPGSSGGALTSCADGSLLGIVSKFVNTAPGNTCFVRTPEGGVRRYTVEDLRQNSGTCPLEGGQRITGLAVPVDIVYLHLKNILGPPPVRQAKTDESKKKKS